MESISRLLANYKVITTNVEGKTTEEKVAKARVILLGERHADPSEEMNDRLVNRLFKEGDLLLTEDEDSHFRNLDKRAKASAKNWDIEEWDSCPDALGYNLSSNASVFPRVYKYLFFEKTGESVPDEKVYLQLVDILKGITPYASAWKQKGGLGAFDDLLPVWLEGSKKIRKAIWLWIRQTFSKRNRSMVKNILAYKGKGKVLVTAGSSHFRYSNPMWFGAIDETYGSLKDVPYITLQPREYGTQPTKREKAGTLHSKEAAREKDGKKLEELIGFQMESEKKLEALDGKLMKDKLEILEKFGIKHEKRLKELWAEGEGALYPEFIAKMLIRTEILLREMIYLRSPVSLSAFKSITSNLQGLPPSQAQVFLLGEETHDESARMNDRLVNQLYRKGDVVLTAHDSKWRDLSPEVLTASKRWDITIKSEEKLSALFRDIAEGGLLVAKNYSEALSDKRVCKMWHDWCAFEIEKVRPFKSTWNENKPVESIHAMLQVWLQEAGKLEKAAIALYHERLDTRSGLIAQSIRVYGGRRVFVLGNIDHFKYHNPQDFKPVDALYKGLQGLRYVTLQARKRGVTQTKREKAGTLHSKNVAKERYIPEQEQAEDWADGLTSTLAQQGWHVWLEAIKRVAKNTLKELEKQPLTLDQAAGSLLMARVLIQQLQKAKPLQSKL